jgi:hypothetical protein
MARVEEPIAEQLESFIEGEIKDRFNIPLTVDRAAKRIEQLRRSIRAM